MKLDALILSADAARILGLTPTQVRQMERRGELPAIQTKSGVRIFGQAENMIPAPGMGFYAIWLTVALDRNEG